LSLKRKPLNTAKRRKAEWHRVVENASRFLSQKPVPRDPAEAHAWLKQLASEMLAAQEKTNEAFRPAVEAVLRDHRRRSQALRAIGRRDRPSRVPVARWGEPFEPWIASPHLVKWFTDAVKAYSPEELTKGKRRARSMDAALGFMRALGLIRPRGRSRGTGDELAIEIYYLREVERLSWNAIASRLQMREPRTAQRIYAAHADAIVRHLISCGLSLQLGYDLKDGKLVINKSEAATVRLIFESYAQVGSAPAPKRALAALVRKLKAEGVTDKRGQPIDLNTVLNNRVYIGEAVHAGMRPGGYEAIIDRALWRKTHHVRRCINGSTCASKGAQKTTLIRRI
jgi:hypothetical protein